ncbi:DNA-binding transcriptional regulator, XRE-family HTH domain [Lachnospiraceae bacterium KHCPX20]|nr:DNA-binding transcriptional regulator, XRE-family HTH domain [Lachnospiraceae bacterium KHCPX20]
MEQSLLSQRLKALRKVNNYTQDYVAAVIGTTRQTYSHYETGRRKPSTETLYKLSGLYNISVDDLLHLSVELDRNVYYEAPGPSKTSEDLSAYLEYFNDPRNQKKFQYNSNLEKELLYYFQMISDHDKREIIEFTKIKAKGKSQ